MSSAVVLVWLGTASARQAHDADLESFARGREIALEDPAPESPGVAPGHDDSVADHVEALLSDARTAEYADPVAAERALADAEALVRSHPDLPEAGWLLGEVLEAKSLIVEKSDPAESATLAERARVLEGDRATAFGRVPASPATTGSTPALAPITGPTPEDDVYVDGSLSTARSLAPGEHHVRVVREGRLVFAGWISASRERAVVPVPLAAPCSEADLSGVSVAANAVHASAVSCADWFLARPAESGIEVARCYGASCGPWLPWREDWGAPFEGPPTPKWAGAPSHDWIFWTATSAFAVVATGLILWRAGAFDATPAPTKSWSVNLPPPR